MGHLLRRVVPVCATVAVIGAALAVTSASGSVPSCVAARVTVKMSVIKGSFGAGNVSYRLTLKNRGPGSCIISTYPALKLLRANGKGLPTKIIRTQKAKTNLIPAGETAKATLRFSPDIPGKGEPARGACEPKAAKIRMTLSSTSSAVGPIAPATSVCQHGTMTMTPLG